jgi:hypothetical protein
MFGFSADEKYQHYLNWFKDQVKDPSNWAEMRADKDCSNYAHEDQTPVPYSRGEALFRMGNPKLMAKAVKGYHQRTKAKIEESYKYVGSNPANGLLNEEYVKNEERRIAINKELAKSYSPYNMTDKQMKGVIEKHTPEPPPEQGQWVPMSAWEAFQHWLKGGQVQQEVKDDASWRSTQEKSNGPKRK